MNRVIHFEIHAVNQPKLSKFYSDIFGWKIEEMKMPSGPLPEENRYWLVHTAPEGSKEPGIDGGMVKRRGPAPKGGEPVTSFICTVDVESLDGHLKKIAAAGGKAVTAKMPVMGVAWLAYCSDPEGNIFGIYQDDKNAK